MDKRMSEKELVAAHLKQTFEMVANKQLPKKENLLFQRVKDLKDQSEQTLEKIRKASAFLNEKTNQTLNDRACSSITVGKDNAPLLVSAKQSADKIMSKDIKGCSSDTEQRLADNEEKMRAHLKKMQENARKKHKWTENMNELIKHVNELEASTADADGVSVPTILVTEATTPEISGFIDADVVASSPINKVKF